MSQSQPTTTLAGDEIVANILTIEAVPREILPDGQARDALMELAASGQDVYAYESAGGAMWNIWLQPLADHRADRNGRVPARVWFMHYEELHAELERYGQR